MRDFIRFMRQVFRILYFIRGVVLSLILLLLVCVVVIAAAEGLPLDQAVYFVLITALTIGYGDITPVTTIGRVASIAAGLLGMLTTGILVAVAVRALALAFQEQRRE